MSRNKKFLLAAIVLLLASPACVSEPTSQVVQTAPTLEQGQPADVSEPTTPLEPTSAPEPTPTPEPTNTPAPTPIPLPTQIVDQDVTMALIPAGPFEMGSEEGNSDESPVHTVYLDAFYMDIFEVTNALYTACVEAGMCNPPAATSSATRSSYFGNPEYDDYPVIRVSWHNAKAYCEWRQARLPTEAEWEKAARGGLEGVEYPWGDNAPVCELDADNGANFEGCALGDTMEIGSFSPNGYGLYDMAGNAWEWVADWYDADYYSTLPEDVRNPLGPDAGGYRVLRGGSWSSDRNDLVRAAYRNWAPASIWLFGFGFRCARSP